jgi:hypothetical protein
MLAEYINENELQFGKDSKIGKKWQDGVPKRRLTTVQFFKKNQQFSR